MSRLPVITSPATCKASWFYRGVVCFIGLAVVGWLFGTSLVSAGTEVTDPDSQACPAEFEPNPGSFASAAEEPEGRAVAGRRLEPLSAMEVIREGRLGRVVDVRPDSAQQQTRLESASAVELVAVRGLARNAEQRLIVAGSGYDDKRLERRLSNWRDVSSGIDLVRGGVPALLLAHDKAIPDSALQTALAVPAGQLQPIFGQSDWYVLHISDETTSAAGGTEGVGVPEPAIIASVSQLMAWWEELGVPSGSMVLLVDRDGQEAPALAVAVSRLLGEPVFHAAGGEVRFSRVSNRFANMRPSAQRNRWGSCP